VRLIGSDISECVAAACSGSCAGGQVVAVDAGLAMDGGGLGVMTMRKMDCCCCWWWWCGGLSVPVRGEEWLAELMLVLLVLESEGGLKLEEELGVEQSDEDMSKQEQEEAPPGLLDGLFWSPMYRPRNSGFPV
jgi:hypothetical protein